MNLMKDIAVDLERDNQSDMINEDDERGGQLYNSYPVFGWGFSYSIVTDSVFLDQLLCLTLALELVKQLENAVAELVEAHENCLHYSSAIHSVAEAYRPGPELTDFKKLLGTEFEKVKAGSSSHPQNHPLMHQFQQAVWRQLGGHCEGLLELNKYMLWEIMVRAAVQCIYIEIGVIGIGMQLVGTLLVTKCVKPWLTAAILNVHHAGQPMPGEEQEDIIMTSTESSIKNLKCPLTGKHITELTEPVRSMDCKHIYEKNAILIYIKSHHNNAKCPESACPKMVHAKRVICDPLLLVEIEEQCTLSRQTARTDVVEDFTEMEPHDEDST
ncbi:hypothetical protein Gotri_022061 [Gossypium trilobum]|uniref:SP-RING-type domain-containing protein n=2 Tax=Gossypium TaxID=3633 RepID=A0A7J9DEP1_9ROSI|nr:hypothetical protein [Gossypium trilobum]